MSQNGSTQHVETQGTTVESPALESSTREAASAPLVDQRLELSTAPPAGEATDTGGHETAARTPGAKPDAPRPETAKTEAKAAAPATSPTALQDMFLNGLRREHIDVVIYLCDGSQERGSVRAFDTFTILLENRSSGKMQLVYKHAIARIFPTRAPSYLLVPDRCGKKS